MGLWLQLNLSDAASPVMEEFIYFHDFVMLVLVIIIIFVGSMMAGSIVNNKINKSLLEGQLIECIWTMIPAIILIQLAIPSLILLYMLEETISPNMTIKAVGHQWYWSYEYSDFWSSEQKELVFDSYLVNLKDSELSNFRLLDVDNRVVLPFFTNVRVLVGSSDVLHAWSVPSLGVKVDAVPGRLNQLSFISKRVGLFFGQCSEICGANHSFMPIVIEMISAKDFLNWVISSVD